MQIKDVNMDDIQINPVELCSYKSVSQQKRISRMAKSLQENGQLEPICVNEDYSIIWKGHTRYLAAKELGWRSIKAIVMSADEWNEYIKAGGRV